MSRWYERKGGNGGVDRGQVRRENEEIATECGVVVTKEKEQANNERGSQL